MSIKCILFDADGVVVRSEIFSVKYSKKFNISNDEMLPFFKGVFQKCLVGEADLKKEIKPWLKKWKWQGNVESFLKFWFEAEDEPDKRMISAIKKLRKEGFFCFLATNQEKYRTEYMRKNMDFEYIFDYIFSSAEIGSKKPEMNFYQFVLNKIKNDYKIKPEEVAFFDDSPENLENAKQAGIRTYFYQKFLDFEKVFGKIIEN